MLEGGFDEAGRFIHVPLSGLDQMTEVFRRRLIWPLVEKELLAEEFGRNLLSWKNSGFSIDNSVRLTDAKRKESLAEYIARPPLSLKNSKDRVTMQPETVVPMLREHLSRVRTLHRHDVNNGWGRVALPDAISRKFPNAALDWRRQWVFSQRVGGRTRRPARKDATVVIRR